MFSYLFMYYYYCVHRANQFAWLEVRFYLGPTQKTSLMLQILIFMYHRLVNTKIFTRLISDHILICVFLWP